MVAGDHRSFEQWPLSGGLCHLWQLRETALLAIDNECSDVPSWLQAGEKLWYRSGTLMKPTAEHSKLNKRFRWARDQCSVISNQYSVFSLDPVSPLHTPHASRF